MRRERLNSSTHFNYEKLLLLLILLLSPSTILFLYRRIKQSAIRTKGSVLEGTKIHLTGHSCEAGKSILISLLTHSILTNRVTFLLRELHLRMESTFSFLSFHSTCSSSFLFLFFPAHSRIHSDDHYVAFM